MVMTAKDVIDRPVFIKKDLDKLSSDLMEPITERLKAINDEYEYIFWGSIPVFKIDTVL